MVVGIEMNLGTRELTLVVGWMLDIERIKEVREHGHPHSTTVASESKHVSGTHRNSGIVLGFAASRGLAECGKNSQRTLQTFQHETILVTPEPTCPQPTAFLGS